MAHRTDPTNAIRGAPWPPCAVFGHAHGFRLVQQARLTEALSKSTITTETLEISNENSSTDVVACKVVEYVADLCTCTHGQSTKQCKSMANKEL